MTKRTLNDENKNLAVVVFCGHSCSGKSYLMAEFGNSRGGFRQLEMDQIRLSIYPGLLNDAPKRSAAYRRMHFEVSQSLLRDRRSVAVDATYLPPYARAELAAIAQRFRAKLFVVQCTCTADVAVQRFLKRSGGIVAREPHAGSDLTAQRVRALAEDYVRFECALTLDTTSQSTFSLLLRVDDYLAKGESVAPVEWANHRYSRELQPTVRDADDAELKKLSAAALRSAARAAMWLRLGQWFFWVWVGLGIFPLANYIRSRLWERTWSPNWKHPFGSLFQLLPNLTEIAHARLDLPHGAEFATFGIALAGVIGLYIAYGRETKEQRMEEEEIRRAGTTAYYPVPKEASKQPFDSEVYHSYLCRLPIGLKHRLAIESVPVFFVIEPKLGVSFQSTVRGTREIPPDSLLKEAAEFGLDWPGFLRSREEEHRKRFAGPFARERGVRCTGVPTLNGNMVTLNGIASRYEQYLARELSVSLFAPGVLPDMRRLLEGPAWDEGSIDPMNFTDAATRYSMHMSVSGLLLTEDGRFLLQRRSSRVSSGLGSLIGAVAGSVDCFADMSNETGWKGIPRRLVPSSARRWNLMHTVHREIWEEIGIESAELEFEKDGPFIGAAFSFRYGRDLNFYSFARIEKPSWQIAEEHQRRLRSFWIERFSHGLRDKWEVDRLEFIDADDVTVKSVTSGFLGRRLRNPSRHLQGALYSWAVYSGRA